jgi:hypothetical protein
MGGGAPGHAVAVAVTDDMQPMRRSEESTDTPSTWGGWIVFTLMMSFATAVGLGQGGAWWWQYAHCGLITVPSKHHSGRDSIHGALAIICICGFLAAGALVFAFWVFVTWKFHKKRTRPPDDGP